MLDYYDLSTQRGRRSEKKGKQENRNKQKIFKLTEITIPAVITVKDLAAEMTSVNIQTKDLRGINPIGQEHVDNNTAVRNKEDSTVKKNQEQRDKSNKVETPKTINVEPKIFYIKDYNYDLSACSQAASNYMNQVLNSSNINILMVHKYKRK